MKRILSFVLLSALMTSVFCFMCACSGSSEETVGYEQISQVTAKKYIDTDPDIIILDTRTDEEFSQGHIPGAILIPHDEIKQRAESELPDKDKLILVYCRSGRRSKIAAQSLAELGYTNVKEFGGINDWEYEIVK